MTKVDATGLWPEEFEALRAEARQIAFSNSGAWVREETDRDAKVAAKRKGVSVLYDRSPDGVDEEVAGVPCRVFRVGTPRGTYVHFHGGGMMIGHPEMDDHSNAALAKSLGVNVISVDYRLAPEHPFPAGVDDCFAVTKSVIDSASGPILLGGESAGAYFSALLAIRLRDETEDVGRICGVNLVFGVYDLSGTPSMLGVRASDVPDTMGADFIPDMLSCYLPGRSLSEAREPACSPMYADLRGLPPALFTVGSADHTLDDSLFMATLWQVHGNRSELAIYPDCGHGFLRYDMELTRIALRRIQAFLEERLAAALGG